MKKTSFYTFAIGLCLVASSAFAQNPYEVAMKAYQEKNYPVYLENIRRVAHVAGNNPEILYRVAEAYSLTGDREKAMEWLRKAAKTGAYYDVSQDADFLSLYKHRLFKKTVQTFEKNNKVITNSSVAFTLAEKDMVPEGIAYDDVEANFYVGSIHKSKIIVINKRGQVQDFVSSGQDGLWGVLGMKVDEKRRLLWVCSMGKDGSEYKGWAAVFKYDLQSGKLIKKYMLPKEAGHTHLLNDVVFNAAGDLFITDSEAGAVYTIPQQTDELTLLVKENFIYPNGIVLSPDENYIFVAHWAGISRIEIATKKAQPLSHPENMTLCGVDGMYWYKGNLVAVQNDLSPARIVVFKLNSAMDGVEKVNVLEQGNPLFIIPTTGTIVGQEFYYIANSQLRSLDGNGGIVDEKALKEIVILKTGL